MNKVVLLGAAQHKGSDIIAVCMVMVLWMCIPKGPDAPVLALALLPHLLSSSTGAQVEKHEARFYDRQSGMQYTVAMLKS
jgi:hypothetical protein